MVKPSICKPSHRPTQRAPTPGKVRRGHDGGSRRVFKQLPGLKPVPSKRRYLVPPRRIDWRSRVEITSRWVATSFLQD